MGRPFAITSRNQGRRHTDVAGRGGGVIKTLHLLTPRYGCFDSPNLQALRFSRTRRSMIANFIVRLCARHCEIADASSSARATITTRHPFMRSEMTRLGEPRTMREPPDR